eukprot:SAG22_NODE_2239_length_2803_cov_2.755917_2_plen_113_part_00
MLTRQPTRAHDQRLINLVWQRKPLLRPADGSYDLPADFGTAGRAANVLFFFFILERGFLVGTPAIGHMTLPTCLDDSDYAAMLEALEAFLVAHAEPLALLSSETAAPTAAKL